MNHAVLLGDAIFDNAAYVPGGLPVATQLRAALGSDWQVTLLAADGHITGNVAGQLAGLPAGATHLVVSVGGNDALAHVSLLEAPSRSFAESVGRLGELHAEFREAYREMLNEVLARRLPAAVCTIYDSVPDWPSQAMTVLASFNDVILREAFARRVPVIDLRLVCSRSEDYSAVSSIEPSAMGGHKIAQAVARLLKEHDFSANRSAIYW